MSLLEMNEPKDLLVEFTNLLAYLGDEGAQNGYSGNIRETPFLTGDTFKSFNDIVYSKLFIDKEHRKNINLFMGLPEDIQSKVLALKKLVNESSPEKKNELREHIHEHDSNYRMQGGKRSKKSKKTKRKATKRKATKRKATKRKATKRK
jgi:hypothetical protein